MSQIIQLPNAPKDQATRFSQFMGDKPPEASLANPMPSTTASIDELDVDAEEKTGILQTGTDAMDELVKSDAPGSADELPVLDAGPELSFESAQASMEKTYAGLPTPEAEGGSRVEIKESGENLTLADENAGLLQTGADAMGALLKSEAPDSGLEVPVLDAGAELTFESGQEAMEKTYAGQPTNEAEEGSRVEIKESGEDLTIEREAPPPSAFFGEELDSSWYVKVANEVLGPFSSNEIRDALKRREFLSDSMMSSSPEGPWKRIDGFPQFASSKAA
jgi:hypothetical protein